MEFYVPFAIGPVANFILPCLFIEFTECVSKPPTSNKKRNIKPHILD